MLGRTVIHSVSGKRYIVVGFCIDVSPNDGAQYSAAICSDKNGYLTTYFLPDLILELSEIERKLLK